MFTTTFPRIIRERFFIMEVRIWTETDKENGYLHQNL